MMITNKKPGDICRIILSFHKSPAQNYGAFILLDKYLGWWYKIYQLNRITTNCMQLLRNFDAPIKLYNLTERKT